MAHFGGSADTGAKQGATFGFGAKARGGVRKRGVLLFATLLVVASVANCGGRSTSVEADGDGESGDAGTTSVGGSTSVGGASAGGASTSGTAGAVSMGGFTTGGATAGSSMGGVAGDPLDPAVRCNMPVSFGACRTRSDAHWFDAKTGLCMPFSYYGCNGNENRFESAEECYGVCAGRGANDLGKCQTSADCRPKRLAEPCCSLDVQEFVGINRNYDFECTEPNICTHCAADCDYEPPDGNIGATCVEGHCIAFDLRDLAPQSCMTSAQCYPRYGIECCPDCSSTPPKIVALSTSFDLGALACGDGMTCADTCGYRGIEAVCSADYECELLFHPI